MEKPFEKAYWVVPGLFLAGDYPGRPEESDSLRRVQALLRIGIREVVDLTQQGESFMPYAPLLVKEAEEYAMDCSHRSFPIKDFGLPTREDVIEILDHIDRQITARRPVYLHCMGGIGRTGTIVGCWLARHGIDGLAVLEELKRLRADTPNWYHSSPETDAQRKLVEGWKKGE